MVRKCIRVCLVAALGVVAMTLAYGAAATAQDKKDDKKKDELPTIKEIMKKGHAKTDGYIDKIKAAVKGEKWDDAKEYAKTLAAFGEALGKSKPEKGDEKSWKTLSDKYAASTKTVLEGAEKKDAKVVQKGLGAINCGECHKVHK